MLVVCEQLIKLLSSVVLVHTKVLRLAAGKSEEQVDESVTL